MIETITLNFQRLNKSVRVAIKLSFQGKPP
jgi:hypothetical protein